MVAGIDRSSMLFDDPLHDGKAKSGPPFSLGEEGKEDLSYVVFRQSGPAVSHRDVVPRPLLHDPLAGDYADGTFPRAEANRVVYQIHEDLEEALAIDYERAILGGELACDA